MKPSVESEISACLVEDLWYESGTARSLRTGSKEGEGCELFESKHPEFATRTLNQEKRCNEIMVKL